MSLLPSHEETILQFLRFKKRDSSGNKFFYENHYAELYNFALNGCGDKETAKDITHDAFTVLFEKVDEINDARHARAFLFYVVKKKILTFRQKEIRSMQMMAELEATLDRQAEIDYKDSVEVRRLAWLKKEIENLPDRTRTVLKMRLAEQSTEEIAKQLGIDNQTVLNHLTKARNRLRAALPKDVYLLLLFLLLHNHIGNSRPTMSSSKNILKKVPFGMVKNMVFEIIGCTADVPGQ